jgi:S-adenosylmethionine decarboxylase
MFMLAESHLTCHTFPEYGSLCLNVFCCRPRPDWDFAGYMKGAFAAATVSVRRLHRPYQSFEGQVK